MTKLQNLFVTLANMDIFQTRLKFSLFTMDFKSNLCYNIVNNIFVYANMQNVWRCMQCLHHLN